MARKKMIDLINECDDFPYTDIHTTGSHPSSSYFSFRLHDHDAVLGYVLPEIAAKFPSSPLLQQNVERKELVFRPDDTPSEPKHAAEYRTKLLADYLQNVREANVFQVLKGWRNELYPVYGRDGQLIFSMERAASALFGIVTYGVHMTAYVQTPSGMKFWTPRRASTKQTYPNMMDNTVAGGLSTGEKPWDCLIRESMEEASLPEDVVKNSRAVGTMTYFHIRDQRAGGESGLCQPECQYVYDLELPETVIPKPGDNEAVDFQLLSLEEVKEALADGKFKPNCAMLLVEFFVRHGIITPENEPNYLEIVTRLHRRLEFPMSRG